MNAGPIVVGVVVRVMGISFPKAHQVVVGGVFVLAHI